MKKQKNYLISAGLLVGLLLAGCSQPKNDKVTMLPVSTQSTEAKASFEKGLVYYDQGDGQKAKEQFKMAIQQDPKLAIAYVFKSGTNETPKEFADDLAMANSNLEGASEWEKLYCEMFNTYLSSDWTKRMEVAQKMVTQFPDAARPQVELGQTYTAGNDYVKGRECFEKAIAMDPKWTSAYYALSTSYLFFEPKNFKMAEENAMKVAELAPSSAGAQILMGDCYRAQKNLEKAKEAYSKAIDLDPNYPEAYYKKGHANTFMGNYDEARQNYADAGKHDESSAFAVMLTGYTYMYAGDWPAATKWLTEQATMADASGESADKITMRKMNCLSTCANIALQNGDAVKMKEMAANMEPLSMQIGNDLGTKEAKMTQQANMMYWHAMAAAVEGKYDEAKSKAEEMKKVVEPLTDPNKLDQYEFAMGYIAMKQKNSQEAVDHFNKTLQSSIYNKYWLAKANESAGNKEKATALMQEVSDYNFNEVGYALVRHEVRDKIASK